ncbi:MAG TPA: Xaa-Pro peptidase family protein [Candidatus Binatia bacterium]|nr:Xaa-Pro peptidase family protein [Candidatus Binatia bacterium]
MTYFSDGEMQRRKERAKELMARDGLDALMVTGDFSACMNYFYLSGHMPRDYQSNFSRPHAMFLTQHGAAMLVVYGVNLENACESSWVEDVRAYAPPFSAEALKGPLQELGLAAGRIGAELGVDQRLWLPFLEFQRLQEMLPDASFVDASRTLWDLRMIKSEEEIAYIRHADLINHRALSRMFAATRAGDTEEDVMRRTAAYLVLEGASRPPHSQILVVSEAKARAKGHRARMLGPSPDALEEGHTLFVDSGALYNGYWGEFNRMGVVGQPSPRQLDNHRKIREIVQRSAREAIKPGTTFREVIEHMVELYEGLGLGQEQYRNYIGRPYMHLLHGIGLNGSEPPFVRMDSEDPLEVGMVMSLEAYLRDDGITYGSEEDVAVTEDGCEILSEIDTGFYIMGTTERAG